MDSRVTRAQQSPRRGGMSSRHYALDCNSRTQHESPFTGGDAWQEKRRRVRMTPTLALRWWIMLQGVKDGRVATHRLIDAFNQEKRGIRRRVTSSSAMFSEKRIENLLLQTASSLQ